MVFVFQPQTYLMIRDESVIYVPPCHIEDEPFWFIFRTAMCVRGEKLGDDRLGRVRVLLEYLHVAQNRLHSGYKVVSIKTLQMNFLFGKNCNR